MSGQKIIDGLNDALEGRFTTRTVHVERDLDDRRECAYIRLKGATTRLLMILEHRSEHNYARSMEAVEAAMAEYRTLPRSP